MIHVIATIDLNPGTREAFLDVFHGLVPKVRAEEGCLAYGPNADVDTGMSIQGPCRENAITIVEQWESLDHLNKHLATPHMAAYRGQVKDYVKGVTLQVVEPV